jgi:hypothetical protein
MPVLSPQRIPVLTSTQVQFATTAPAPVVWDADNGTISPNGLYTAPETPGVALVSCTSNGETLLSTVFICEEFRWSGQFGQGGTLVVPGKVSLAMDRSRQARRRGQMRATWKLQMRLEDFDFREFMDFYDATHLRRPFWYDDGQTEVKGFFWFDSDVEFTYAQVLTWDVQVSIHQF